MNSRELVFAVLIGVSVGAQGEISDQYNRPAAPHTVTYEKISVSPGSTVQVNGYTFLAARVPVVDFSGARYAVTYLTSRYIDNPPDNIGIETELAYYHTRESFEPDLVIDGYPAKLEITEEVEVTLTGGFCQTGEIPEGSYCYYSNPETKMFLTIDIGDAHVLFQMSTYGQGTNNTSRVLESPNAIPGTQWWKLEENSRPVRVLDWLIDHIRIYKFP